MVVYTYLINKDKKETINLRSDRISWYVMEELVYLFASSHWKSEDNIVKENFSDDDYSGCYHDFKYIDIEFKDIKQNTTQQ